jgi:hypothetical protein
MKKGFTQTIVALCLLFVASATSCSKADISLLNQFNGVEVSVPAISEDYTAFSYEITKEEWVQALNQNNIKFDINKIKSVGLNTLTLSLPDDGSLKNFDNYRFGDVSFVNPKTNQDTKVAFYDATNGDIPAGTTTVNFSSQYDELKEFLTFEKFTVKGRLFTRANTPAAKFKVNLGTKLVIKPE